jgi:hypothetical protein
MIIDIPTFDDFESSGIIYLNLAWNSVQEILLTLDEADIADWETDHEVSDEFWASAQKPLITSLALVQQATELLLKGKIVEVSPYLLISGDPKNWPRGCDKADIPFVDFRTIDAQDLIRVFNTVACKRLDDSFIEIYENLRRVRNRIMHSVDKKFRTNPKEIMLTILEVIHNLAEPCSWINKRRNYLVNQPNSIAFGSTEHVEGNLATGILFLVDLIDKAKFKKYFGIDLRKRRYHCSDCNINCSNYSESPKLAQLDPSHPTSTNLHCYLCGVDRKVMRKSCANKNCKSNVIDAEDGVCLLCLEEQ